MKLLRYGAPGAEKPGLLHRDGTIRDLSGLIDDLSGAALSPDSLAGLAEVPVQASTSEGPAGGGIKRPAYSILAHRRLEELGVNVMRPWSEALAEYVASLD